MMSMADFGQVLLLFVFQLAPQEVLWDSQCLRVSCHLSGRYTRPSMLIFVKLSFGVLIWLSRDEMGKENSDSKI